MGIDRSRIAARWELVLPHRPALVRVARSRGLSPEDAEECAQEAMLRCVEFAGLDEARVLPFLVTTTVRLCADRGRERVRDRRLAAKLTGWHAAAVSPEDSVCDRAEAEWLAGQLGDLPDWQKGVLAARAEGLGTAEVAERFQVSYKSVESHLYRVRLRARTLLAGAVGTLLACGRRLGRPRVVAATSVAAITTLSLLLAQPHPGEPAPRQVPFEWPERAEPVALAPAPAPTPARSPQAVATPAPRRAVARPGRPPRTGPTYTPVCPFSHDPGFCAPAPPVTSMSWLLWQTQWTNCVLVGIDTSNGLDCDEPSAAPSERK